MCSDTCKKEVNLVEINSDLNLLAIQQDHVALPISALKGLSTSQANRAVSRAQELQRHEGSPKRDWSDLATTTTNIMVGSSTGLAGAVLVAGKDATLWGLGRKFGFIQLNTYSPCPLSVAEYSWNLSQKALTPAITPLNPETVRIPQYKYWDARDSARWFQREWEASALRQSAEQTLPRIKELEYQLWRAMEVQQEAARHTRNLGRFYLGEQTASSWLTRKFADSKVDQLFEKVEQQGRNGKLSLHRFESWTGCALEKERLLKARDAFEAERTIMKRAPLAEAELFRATKALQNPLSAATRRSIIFGIGQGLLVTSSAFAFDFLLQKISASISSQNSEFHKWLGEQPSDVEIGLSVAGSFLGRTIVGKIAFASSGWAIGKTLRYYKAG